jgi:hypothetical protein
LRAPALLRSFNRAFFSQINGKQAIYAGLRQARTALPLRPQPAEQGKNPYLFYFMRYFLKPTSSGRANDEGLDLRKILLKVA